MSSESNNVYNLYIEEKGTKPTNASHFINFAKLKGIKLKYIDAKKIIANPPTVSVTANNTNEIDNTNKNTLPKDPHQSNESKTENDIDKKTDNKQNDIDNKQQDKDGKIIKNPQIVLIGSSLVPNATTNINKLKQLFTNKYGFKNISIAADKIDSDNIDKDILNSYLNDTSSLIQLNKKVDSLIIIYSGYGYFDNTNNYLLCDDGNKLLVKQMIKKFASKNCDYLSDKPKILYLDYYHDQQDTYNQLNNAIKFRDFFIHSALFKADIEDSPFIEAIYNCYMNNKSVLSLNEMSETVNTTIKNKVVSVHINELEYKIYIQSNIKCIDNDDIKYMDNGSWKDKDTNEWTTEELQSWVKTLDINDKQYESKLLQVLQETGTTPQDIEDLNSDVTDIPKPAFSMFITQADDMLNWLSAKLRLLKKKQQVEIFNKHINEWSCNELVQWIGTLNIAKVAKELLKQTITEMDCNGSDLNSCESVEEITESFDEIDVSVAKVVYKSMVNLRTQ